MTAGNITDISTQRLDIPAIHDLMLHLAKREFSASVRLSENYKKEGDITGFEAYQRISGMQALIVVEVEKIIKESNYHLKPPRKN